MTPFERGYYRTMKLAGIGDDIKGALGIETDADRARRNAMIGAAVPGAGMFGGALGGGLAGGGRAAAGGALGSMAGGSAGALLGGLAGAGLGALALKGPASRVVRKIMESEAIEEGAQRAGRKAFHAAPFDDVHEAAAAARKAFRENPVLDPSVVSELDTLSSQLGRGAGAAGGAIALGLPAAYAGNIYGAGRGAEYGASS